MGHQKLLTKAIEKKLPPLYSSERIADPTVVVKFFCPWNQWTWYALEYSADERRFFGLVVGHDVELGYFSLDEMLSVKHFSGLRIERDICFTPTPLSEVRERVAKWLGN